jgi:transcription antitermination protein NusB
LTIPNRKFREILFLLLFAQAQGNEEKETHDESALIALVMEQLKVSKAHVLRSIEKARLIQSKIPELDGMIQKVVISYEYDRIQTVEKTALRLGTYELFYQPELPPKIAIAEALRLTKKFGTPAATSFVNALLDALYKLNQGESINERELKTTWHQLQQSEQKAHEAIHTTPPSPDSE